jgi:hypothetical protein
MYIAKCTVRWGEGPSETEFFLSNPELRLADLRQFICNFVDLKVAIQWEEGQRALNEALGEAGLPPLFLLAAENNECLVNRPLLDMSSPQAAEEQLLRLAHRFAAHVTEEWEIVIKSYNF